jgi:hypothetical protein
VLCYTCTPHPLILPLKKKKKIDFKKKVVSDVTSETTFFLKSIFLRKKGRQRGDERCIYNISQDATDRLRYPTKVVVTVFGFKGREWLFGFL